MFCANGTFFMGEFSFPGLERMSRVPTFLLICGLPPLGTVAMDLGIVRFFGNKISNDDVGKSMTMRDG